MAFQKDHLRKLRGSGVVRDGGGRIREQVRSFAIHQVTDDSDWKKEGTVRMREVGSFRN
jgi:hypothetical protein